MAYPLPALVATTLADRRILLDDIGRREGADITLDSTNTDAGSVPTFRMRPGNVVVREAASGRYREANDALGDRNTPAAVTALVTGAVAHQLAVITLSVDGGPAFAVTLGAADDTDAEIAAALNANARFAGECIADVVAARVRIRTINAGSGKTLEVSDDVAAPDSLFGAAATPSRAFGADADYRVTADFADLEDENGAAIDAPVKNFFAGHFDESNLINLTAEARAVLSRRGAHFES